MSMVSPQLVLPVGPRDHIRGCARAPVILLEYGDYECPYCGATHPIIESVRGVMRNRLRFVYRHFPLASVHPHAQQAAEAAEAAGAQGRFWAMHDRLFDHQDALDTESLLAHAAAIGLDTGRVADELAAGVHRPRVREDFASGVRSGVNGTPTFYVNGVRHDGAADVASLIRAIERARPVA
jgi:protein-disulfide isomerase